MPPVEIRSSPLRPQVKVIGRKLKQSVRVVFRARERILRQPLEPAADVAAPGQAQRMAAAAGRRLDLIQIEQTRVGANAVARRVQIARAQQMNSAQQLIFHSHVCAAIQFALDAQGGLGSVRRAQIGGGARDARRRGGGGRRRRRKRRIDDDEFKQSHAVIQQAALPDFLRHALVKDSRAAANHRLLTAWRISERQARRKVVAVFDVRLPTVSQAGGQTQIRAQLDLVLNETEGFALRERRLRLPLVDAVNERTSGGESIQAGEFKHAAEIRRFGHVQPDRARFRAELQRMAIECVIGDVLNSQEGFGVSPKSLRLAARESALHNYGGRSRQPPRLPLFTFDGEAQIVEQMRRENHGVGELKAMPELAPCVSLLGQLQTADAVIAFGLVEEVVDAKQRVRLARANLQTAEQVGSSLRSLNVGDERPGESARIDDGALVIDQPLAAHEERSALVKQMPTEIGFDQLPAQVGAGARKSVAGVDDGIARVK